MTTIATENDMRGYCEAFTKKHRAVLNPALNYDVKAIVSKVQGSLVFLEFKPGDYQFTYEEIDEPISRALAGIPQRAIVGDLSGVTFAGTNIIREGNKLIIIKGDNSPGAWSIEEAEKEAVKEVKAIRGLLTHKDTK